MRGTSRALVAALLLAATLAHAADERRHALVVGNAAYKRDRLDNTVNDARAVGEALRALGFEVTRLENATRREMFEAIRVFGDQIKAGGVGLFYFAGHGVQAKGRNYLVPVDSLIEREDEVARDSIDAAQIIEKMESAKNPLNLMILDACRDNPFVRSTRSTGSGLAPMDAPVGTLIAFATAPGAKASDGTGGKHGVYTQHLLTHMRIPDLKVEDVFKRVRVAVRNDTGGRQIPWEHSSLVGDFYFVPRAPSAGEATDRQRERELWAAIKDGGSGSDYRAYLERYPNGEHASVASERVNTPAPTPGRVQRGPGEFSFSRAEEAAAREREQAAPAVCEPGQRRQPVRLEVVEQVNTVLAQRVGRPAGGAADAIATRLKAAGLAIGPGAYVLRGTISSQAGSNRVLRVNEVISTAALELVDGKGRLVSNLLLRNETFAGSDFVFAYQEVVDRQANEAVARVVKGVCGS